MISRSPISGTAVRKTETALSLDPRLAAALGPQLVAALTKQYATAGVPLKDLEKYLDLKMPTFHDPKLAKQLEKGETAIQTVVRLKLQSGKAKGQDPQPPPAALVEATFRAVLDVASQQTGIVLDSKDTNIMSRTGAMYVMGGAKYLQALQTSPLVKSTLLNLHS